MLWTTASRARKGDFHKAASVARLSGFGQSAQFDTRMQPVPAGTACLTGSGVIDEHAHVATPTCSLQTSFGLHSCLCPQCKQAVLKGRHVLETRTIATLIQGHGQGAQQSPGGPGRTAQVGRSAVVGRARVSLAAEPLVGAALGAAHVRAVDSACDRGAGELHVHMPSTMLECMTAPAIAAIFGVLRTAAGQ
jgi:hypothetical protein